MVSQQSGLGLVEIDSRFWKETSEGRACYAHILRMQDHINKQSDLLKEWEAVSRRMWRQSNQWKGLALLAAIGFGIALWRML